MPVILFLIVSLLLPACGVRKSHQESPVLKAYRLIDQQRTDEAIELLEGELEKDAGNTEVRVVLASAYAHKSGFKIQKFLPLIGQAERIQALQKKLTRQVAKSKESSSNSSSNSNSNSSLSQSLDQSQEHKAKSSLPDQQRVNQAASQLATVLSQMSAVVEVYATIPAISEQKVIYLNHAISLLSDERFKLKNEDVLYRALLRIVYFKHLVNDKLLVPIVEPNSNAVPKMCRFNIEYMNESILNLGHVLIDFIQDLGQALPKKSQEMKELSLQVSNQLSATTVAVTGLAALDEASKAMLAQLSLQYGFGKLLQCE